ncbi:MAG: hypothetical protein WC820_01130 [Spirochaetales bacterium]|jgi:hypothetical protein
MMKCEDTRSFVDAWEVGEMTTTCTPEEFRMHLASCPDCSRRFGALLPLMERDLDLAASASPSPLPAGFADDVMAAIGSRGRQGFVFSPLIAAAAAAIFVVGLGLGIFFTKLNSDIVTVSFLLDAPQAKSVYLAGDFNAWSGDGYALSRVRPDGKWEIKIPLKKGKVYVYNFVVDGTKWIVDPSVPAKVDDGFGGSGSLLRL